MGAAVIQFPVAPRAIKEYKLYTLRDLLAVRRDPNRWIINGVFPRVGRVVVFGKPSTCKSLILMDLALAVSTGGLFLNSYHSRVSGPVIMLSSEGDLESNSDRVLDNIRARGIASSTIDDIFHWGQEAISLNTPLGYMELEKMLQRIQPKLLIIDPLVSFYTGDENLQSEVAPFLQSLDRIVARYKLCLVVLHHKNAKGGIRGSTAWEGWADTELEFEGINKEDVLKDTPFVDEDLGAIHMLIKKQRNGKAGRFIDVIPLVRPAGAHMTTFSVAYGGTSDVAMRYLALRIYAYLRRRDTGQTTNQIRQALRRNHKDVQRALMEVLLPAGLVRQVTLWRRSQYDGGRGRSVDGGWVACPAPVDIEHQLIQSSLMANQELFVNGEYIDD